MSSTILDTSAIRAISGPDLRELKSRYPRPFAVSSLTITELLAHLADPPTKRRPDPFGFYRSNLAKCRDLVILPDPFQQQRVRFGTISASELHFETATWQEVILLLESSNSLAEFYDSSPLASGVVRSCEDLSQIAQQSLDELAERNRSSFRSIVNIIADESLIGDVKDWAPGALNHIISTSIDAIRNGSLASLRIQEQTAYDSLYTYVGYMVEILRRGIGNNAGNFTPLDNDAIDELLTLHIRLSQEITLVTNDNRLVAGLAAVIESAREIGNSSLKVKCAVASLDSVRQQVALP